MLSDWLFSLARTPLAGHAVRFFLSHMSFLLPVERLRETDTLLAFHHPRPSYPLHILILPKRNLANFLALGASDADFLSDLVQVVQSLVRDFDLEARGYRLVTNGGPYQDVPHLHVHLISEL